MEISIEKEDIKIEYTRDLIHGDFASNIAMILAGKLKHPPQQIADSIINKLLEQNSEKLFIDLYFIIFEIHQHNSSIAILNKFSFDQASEILLALLTLTLLFLSNLFS